jgi:hypothetical protein
MPARAIRCVGHRSIAALAKRILRNGRLKPSTLRSVVVLPAPFAPSRATTLPAAMSVTSNSACVSP